MLTGQGDGLPGVVIAGHFQKEFAVFVGGGLGGGGHPDQSVKDSGPMFEEDGGGQAGDAVIEAGVFGPPLADGAVVGQAQNVGGQFLLGGRLAAAFGQTGPGDVDGLAPIPAGLTTVVLFLTQAQVIFPPGRAGGYFRQPVIGAAAFGLAGGGG